MVIYVPDMPPEIRPRIDEQDQALNIAEQLSPIGKSIAGDTPANLLLQAVRGESLNRRHILQLPQELLALREALVDSGPHFRNALTMGLGCIVRQFREEFTQEVTLQMVRELGQDEGIYQLGPFRRALITTLLGNATSE